MGPRFRVSSKRLEKPGIEPTTPGLEGEQLNHYATEASGSSAFVLLIVDVDEPSVRICATINCCAYIRAPHVITCLVKSKYEN